MRSIDDDNLVRENQELKAELAALKARVTALEPKPPAPPKIEGAGVFHPIPAASCVMPSRHQLEQLVELAFGTYPQWRPKDWSDEFARSRCLNGFERTCISST